MSGRAVNWVWDNHNTKGTKLTVLLAIAKLSHRQSCPFKAFASYDSIAKLCGITERYAINVVADLIAEQQLEITRDGEGSRANYYDILPLVDVNRGSVLSLNYCSPLQQKRASDFDDRMQESPPSRADQQAVNDPPTGKIIRYPKAPRKARTA